MLSATTIVSNRRQPRHRPMGQLLLFSSTTETTPVRRCDESAAVSRCDGDQAVAGQGEPGRMVRQVDGEHAVGVVELVDFAFSPSFPAET